MAPRCSPHKEHLGGEQWPVLVSRATSGEVLASVPGHFLICSAGCCHGDWARVSTGCRVNACSKNALRIHGLLQGSLVLNVAVKLLKRRSHLMPKCILKSQAKRLQGSHQIC